MSQTAGMLLCHYHEGANQVHHFVFSDSTRAALQQWANHLEQLQLRRVWYNRAQVYLLLDTRAGMEFPLRHVFEIIADYNRSYPQLDAPQIVMAVLHHSKTSILEIYPMMAELLQPPLKLQFFTDSKAAEQWLAQQQA